MQKLIISKDNCFVIPKYNQAHDFSNVSELNRHINKLWSVWLVLKKIIKASERTLKNHQKRLAAGRAVEFWGYMLYFKSQQVGAASCPVQDCSEEHGRLKFTHGALCLYLLLNSSLCVQYSSNYFERYNLAWTYSTVKKTFRDRHSSLDQWFENYSTKSKEWNCSVEKINCINVSANAQTRHIRDHDLQIKFFHERHC